MGADGFGLGDSTYSHVARFSNNDRGLDRGVNPISPMFTTVARVADVSRLMLFFMSMAFDAAETLPRRNTAAAANCARRGSNIVVLA